MNYLLFALLLATTEVDRPPRPEPWYERVFDRINPDDIDYGALWEAQKQALIDAYLMNPRFRYSFASTVAVIFLMVLLYVQKLSYERSMKIDLRSIVHLRRHDEYLRQVAGEAIRRYNERIEACNRIIEASESQTSELEALKQEYEKSTDELAISRRQVKALETLLEEKSAQIAALSRPPDKPQKENPRSKPPASPEHVQQINKLEQELSAERRRNLRVKGTRPDVRDR